jgi:tetratricopeptide (TPR) repeat protein
MPKNQAADVHATQTDHRVLRKPDLSSPADSGAPDDESTLVMKLFQEKGSDPPGWELERAMAIFQAERMRGASKQELKPVIDVLVANVQAHPDDVEAGYILGTAFETIELKQLAQLAWEKVVAARPMHEDAIEALAVQAHEGKDLVQAKKLYQRLIELNPQRSHYYGRLAHVLGQAGEKEAAIAAAKKCLELNPSLMQTHAWLAEVYTVMGDARNAAYHSAIVERAREALNPPGGP